MMYGGLEIQLHVFPTFTLDGDEWSASCRSCFIPAKLALSTCSRQMGARATLAV
jgi:hypothetical protein